MKIRKMLVGVVAPLMAGAGLVATGGAAEAACGAGNLCAWEHINKTGAKASFGGDNANWGNFSKSTGGSWNDVASSVQNNGTSGMGVYLYQHSSYGGDWLCLPKGYSYNNLGNQGFNDKITSNKWSWNC